MFPAGAGMNRVQIFRPVGRLDVPRRRGDEPCGPEAVRAAV